MIDTLERVVRGLPFFQGMADRHIQLIAGCASNVRFASGRFVFRAGEAADHFYLIREGQVAVQFAIPHGTARTVRTVADGEVVGWSWLCAPYRWHFDARAQKTTVAMAFDGKCLRLKCEEDHELGYAMYTRFTQMAADTLQSTLLQLVDVYETAPPTVRSGAA